jgi:hypothetical protein
MRITEYRGRRAVQLENSDIRVTLTVEGGHIAEILHRATGVNPLWTPPWPSIEPSKYNRATHPQYGDDAEAKLLAGIMGHNLCLDIFGSPSKEEAAAGLTVHGEASVLKYQPEFAGEVLIMRGILEHAQLAIRRTVQLQANTVRISESVQNVSAFDRPIAWTQHVTLGPPFLERGKTRFHLTATKSKTFEGDFGDSFARGAEFEWPHAPGREGGAVDLRVYPERKSSAGFTTHLMDPQQEYASFAAYSPTSGVLFGYRWRRQEFPWCGIWEENHSRQQPPWDGKTMTRGMEFGVSPIPETRREMINRGSLFGVPAFAWIPAKATVSVSYEARITKSASGDVTTLFTER